MSSNPTILWSVIIPFGLMLLYGLFVAGREELIRDYLRRAEGGWRRKRYVKEFVRAVRGDTFSGLVTAFALALAVGVYGLAVLFSVLGVQAEGWEERSAANVREVEMLMSRALGPPPETEPSPSNVFEELQEVLAEAESLERSSRHLRYVATSLFYVFLILSAWIVAYWRPLLVLRVRFAAELKQLTFRIQGLANEAELVELIRVEGAVKDEQTLRAFVRVMKTIAARHGVSSLVDLFEWPEEEEQGEGEEKKDKLERVDP